MYVPMYRYCLTSIYYVLSYVRTYCSRSVVAAATVATAALRNLRRACNILNNVRGGVPTLS